MIPALVLNSQSEFPTTHQFEGEMKPTKINAVIYIKPMRIFNSATWWMSENGTHLPKPRNSR